MTEQVRIDPKIANHVDAALAAGFTIYAQAGRTLAPVGHVYVCKDWDGPFAILQIPSHIFDPVMLDVPIQPHQMYGSAVLVDHDGTPEGVVKALEKACAEPMVSVRFMARAYVNAHGVPVVPNYGNKTITRYGRKLADMVVLGERGSNWIVPQLAGRLEPGDRFEHNGQVVEVEAKRYGGPDYQDVIIMPTGGPVVTLPQRQFVTLVGAA